MNQSIKLPSPATRTCSRVVELRQYTLHPGRRDALVELFEREFIEPQEALGIDLIGQFRDLDRPDRFVWLRGFADMPARGAALAAFYGGPAWLAHRDAANATMIDSDDVLLLRPAWTGSGFASAAAPCAAPPRGRQARVPGFVAATLWHCDAVPGADFLRFFEAIVVPALRECSVEVAAAYVTETAVNNFPRLPVREDARVFAWFACHADEAEYERHRAALASSPRWQEVEAAVRQRVRREETLRLVPTPHSRQPAKGKA